MIKVIKRSKENGKFIKKYNVNDNFFNIESKEKYWLIGFIAADGNVSKNLLSITQSKNVGLDLINYIKELLNYDGIIYESNPPLSTEIAYKLCISSKQIIDDLYKYNITERKTYIYEYSNNIIDIKSFLRGYFEGDGSIGVYNNSSGKKYLISSFVGTKKFIDKMSELLPLKYSSKRNIHNDLYELRYNGNKAIIFMNWLYEDELLYKSYKYKIFQNYLLCDDYNRVLKTNIKKSFYNQIKITIFDKIKNGITSAQIVKDIKLTNDIPFQTIYKYIKQYNNG